MGSVVNRNAVVVVGDEYEKKKKRKKNDRDLQNRRLVRICQVQEKGFSQLWSSQILSPTDMLQEALDSFTNTEFWYVDQGIVAPEVDGSASFCKTITRQDGKWWLPVPRVPAATGLTIQGSSRITHGNALIRY